MYGLFDQKDELDTDSPSVMGTLLQVAFVRFNVDDIAESLTMLWNICLGRPVESPEQEVEKTVGPQ